MIGVIVWSNRIRGQAVIWCEDHAALAYLSGSENCPDLQDWPEAGDLVELDTRVEGELRTARNVRPLSHPPLAVIPEMLRSQQTRGPAASSLRVVNGNRTQNGRVLPVRGAAAS